MVKKRLIMLALKEANLKGSEALSEKLQGSPALLFSEVNPFSLARIITENKSEAPAKEGDIAPSDIMIPAGPTSLPPGPVIGDLQKARIPASIEGDKIHVKQDTLVAKEGDEINSILAGVLAKLGVTPMEIGLNLLAVWEDGTIYEKDILFVPQSQYIEDLVSAHQNAFNLAINAGYPTKDTMPLLLSKAHSEAFSLAMELGVIDKETVEPLLAKGHAQAESLKEKAGVQDPPAEAEETLKEIASETSEEAKAAEAAEKSEQPAAEGKEPASEPAEQESKSAEGAAKDDPKSDEPAKDDSKEEPKDDAEPKQEKDDSGPKNDDKPEAKDSKKEEKG